MPGGNGTGPAGAGAKTGRCAGFCSGNAIAVVGQGKGMGLGRGGRMGRGRGLGRAGAAGFNPAPQNLNADQELEVLKGQTRFLEDSLKEIKNRTEELQRHNQ